MTFYRNRGDNGTVNLNRVDTGVMSPIGLFCCEVPDGNNVTQRLCADIGESYFNHSMQNLITMVGVNESDININFCF